MWKTIAPRKGDLKWHMPDIHVASAMGDVAKLMELLEKADEEVGRSGWGWSIRVEVVARVEDGSYVHAHQTHPTQPT